MGIVVFGDVVAKNQNVRKCIVIVIFLGIGVLIFVDVSVVKI
jgi:hypothetical protein